MSGLQMPAWRKATYSQGTANCAEVAAWRKSGRSDSKDCAEVAAWRKAEVSASGNCVEIGQGSLVVGIRDSKDLGGPELVFGPAAWGAFCGRISAGQRAMIKEI